jgi:pimeloyl-ACP methyl ester carboxylesterase
VRCPVLLMQGENDQLVGQSAARAIAAACGDRATLRILPRCGHAFLVRDAEDTWRSEVRQFLAQKVATEGVATSAMRLSPPSKSAKTTE